MIKIDPSNLPTASQVAEALRAREIGQGAVMDYLQCSHPTAAKIVKGDHDLSKMEFGRVVRILAMLKDTPPTWQGGAD